MGVLSEIIANKQRELPGLRRLRLPEPPSLVPASLTRRSGCPLHLIAEIKRRSPSAGTLSTVLSVGERAAAYEQSGASMISVLCDETYFDGSFERLREARDSCRLPLLCKEFIIDEVQLDAARAFGASAALLIVRCLTDQRLAALIQAARERELLPLVEIFNEQEAQRALDAGALHIGVNARDLDTLELDEERAARVLMDLPAGVNRAYFSGIRTPADVTRAAHAGADAALVGEVLMRADNPGPLLQTFVQAAREAID